MGKRRPTDTITQGIRGSGDLNQPQLCRHVACGQVISSLVFCFLLCAMRGLGQLYHHPASPGQPYCQVLSMALSVTLPRSARQAPLL